MKQSRRSFLQKSTKAAAAGTLLAGFPTILSAGSYRYPPSDQLNVGLIGCRGRGFHVLRRHLDLGGINCVALCDVDEKVLNERAKSIKEEDLQKPKLYKDFRKLLEQKDIDAVIIGTPDHWHCLQTVYACEAGKDVYVEKPMANSIAECLLIVKAAKRYNRIVQVGQQQRSGKLWQEIMDYMKKGKIGYIRKANIWCNFNYGLGPEKRPDEAVPEGVDYDLYLGPAPSRPFNPNRFHGAWRHFWDYGGGLMTDWGVHLIDMALWVKDVSMAPTTVLAYGTKLNQPELAKDAYDTMSVVYPLDGYTIQWESSAGKQTGPYDRNYGLAFLGDNGTLVADRSGWRVIPEWDQEAKAFRADSFNSEKNDASLDTTAHVQNFVDCIKSREAPVCPPEIGANVAMYSHMANIAVRSDSYKLEWEDQKGKFIKNKAANQLVAPLYRKPWVLPDV